MNKLSKSIILLLSVLGIAVAETKNCGCSEKSPSRAATLIGEKKLSFTVLGMSCSSCEKDLTEKLKKLETVINVDLASHKEKSVKLTVKPDACETTLKEEIKKAGYLVKEK